MKVNKPFRLMDRIDQVITNGMEVAAFNVSNVWRYEDYERGRISGTDVMVRRVPGDVVWEVVT